MRFTPAKLKGRIKSLANKNNADARVLLRIYMMERFLEHIHHHRLALEIISHDILLCHHSLRV